MLDSKFYKSDFPNPLLEVNVWRKIEWMEASANRILTRPDLFFVPKVPGRDVAVRTQKKQNVPRRGLSEKEGRAQLLHDLAGIELQAFELGIRTLIEFPEAPREFREELLRITLEESKHLKLCLEGLDHLDFQFGHWDTHLNLWNSVCEKDSFIDRIVIVHRYLEGAGLDASELLLRRLSGVGDSVVTSVVKVIADEEVSHVQFGSFWYKKLLREEKKDPDLDFKLRMERLKVQIPARQIPLAREQRIKAGFSVSELETLSKVQTYFREEPPLRPR